MKKPSSPARTASPRTTKRPADARTERGVERLRPRQGVAGRRGRQVEAGLERHRRARRQVGGADLQRRAALPAHLAAVVVVADGALDVLGGRRQVHGEVGLGDVLRPAGRDQVPVELRVVAVGAGLEDTVDAVADLVDVVAGRHEAVGVADLGDPVLAALLARELDRHAAAVHGDADVVGDPAGVGGVRRRRCPRSGRCRAGRCPGRSRSGPRRPPCRRCRPRRRSRRTTRSWSGRSRPGPRRRCRRRRGPPGSGAAGTRRRTTGRPRPDASWSEPRGWRDCPNKDSRTVRGP